MRSTTRRTIGATVLVALTIAALSVAASARPAYLEDRREGDDPRSILWEPKQAAFEKMQAATALPPDPARASQDDYDAYYYDIDIEIEDGPETVAGSVVMRGTNLVSNLTAVILNLYDNLTVDSVALDGAPASFTHQNDLLTVTTNGLIAPGATFEVDVVYHGAPIDDALNFSSHDGWPIISSLSEPIGARQW